MDANEIPREVVEGVMQGAVESWKETFTAIADAVSDSIMEAIKRGEPGKLISVDADMNPSSYPNGQDFVMALAGKRALDLWLERVK